VDSVGNLWTTIRIWARFTALRPNRNYPPRPSKGKYIASRDVTYMVTPSSAYAPLQLFR